MRVTVRVDAGPLIGGGHAMRCLTLADALAGEGANVTFVSATMPDSIAERIRSAGHLLARIGAVAELLQREGSDWHEPPLPADVQLRDAALTQSACGECDWLIVDHYLLDAHWHSAARNFAGKVLVVDDLANRHYDCDLLLDQTFGRNASNYRAFVPPTAKVLTGAIYALLRSEFARERPLALKRREEIGPVGHVLVSMGTTDIGGMTAGIVEQLLALAPNCDFDVIVGPEAPSLARLKTVAHEAARLSLHIGTNGMAELMRDADLAIGAAGSTSWERSCLGLPAIALVLAGNQRAGAEALAEVGAIIAVDETDEIAREAKRLIGDTDRLAAMSAAAFPIADGLGTDRVVRAMKDSDSGQAVGLTLRPATMDDAMLLWLWRNDPLTRRQSRTTSPIPWAEHVRWLTAALGEKRRTHRIGERDGSPVGAISLQSAEGGSEVSIMVAPEERGTGVGRSMLKAALAETDGFPIYASVRADNDASRKLFEFCGFKQVESAETGFLRYVLDSEVRRRKLA
jgi:UDP-2,4-diacetamido-2,4,6-trideoxy-beta-L-altropyranose hydrolase